MRLAARDRDTRGGLTTRWLPAAAAIQGGGLLTALAVACALATGVRAAGPQQSSEDARRAREVYRQAVEREARGDADGALALLWTASGLTPDDPEIQSRLAMALERVGALEAAVEAWRAAVAAAPRSPGPLRGLVLALVASGRSTEAVRLARGAADERPDDVDALFTLGLAQSEQDVEAALATFQRVLARAPAHTLARYNYALLLKRLDRLDEAVAELRRVVVADPRPEAHHALGMALWHRGDAAGAILAFEAAVSAAPRHADAHRMLGVAFASRRDWGRAAAALRRALDFQPDAAATHETMARVLRASGDADGAKRHAAEAARLRRAAEREQQARVWTSTGTARLDADDALGALDALRRAVAILDTYAPAHFQMGRALERLGDEQAADAAFDRARTLNPYLVRPPRQR